jgi:hypothetical protein
MIVVWGIKEDLPLQMVYEELQAKDADTVFLDHREIFNSELEFSFNGESDLKIIYGNRIIQGSDISAVYQRPYDYHQYEELENKPFGDPLAIHAARFEYLFQSWMDCSDKLIVNRKDNSAGNFSKPFQLTQIRKAGFLIPETYITNDPALALEFIHGNPDSIYKSISSVRSIVKKVSSVNMDRMQDIIWCPTQFQRFIEGTNYRVHVVANKIFATKILSEDVDYRYANNIMIAVTLPEEISNRCIDLTASLGLHFSGIDLKLTPEGEWYCFEVNPSPAFSYFQLKDGQQVSSALAELLISAEQLQPEKV